MDKDTRSLLQRATQAARRTLEEDFGAQLEGVFDIRPDGTVAPEAGRHLAEDGEAQRVRVKLVAAFQHHREQGRRPADAVAAVLRECAFTTLNRFVALKMLEAREIVKPCVSLGPLSSGFKEFTGLAPGLATLPDQGYRLYLDSLFDEIGREVKVLFDRRDPASLLWPRKTALDALLGILNDAALAGVWGEDETIGWVYQYFNGKDEREEMRDPKRGGSDAPRNSRELAVRNQFFTPRFVVEFLTENTLGRTWLEMRRGETRLVESCRYLVKRPSEVFLAEGEAEPVADATTSPEARPSYVPFRAKKDPRDLRVLDPACGSGHFLLYSFDQLLVIYEEAWSDPASPASEATARSLATDYPTLEALRQALPGLVLRHNLFGVDIDPRAAQIAALALWMRAQRAWSDFGFRRAERPLVTRTNIVVAEPMPGEADLLNGLCAGLDKPVADIVRAVFEDMKLAGEAGMLLSVEDTVRRGVERLAEVGGLFASEDARRWERLEAKVYGALGGYAESVGGSGYRRRLFAEDAAQGFAFVEVCRQDYDIILMNPPFGLATSALSQTMSTRFPEGAGNLYSLFALRMRNVAGPHGRIGAITDSTFMVQSSFEAFRDRYLLGPSGGLELLADLGWGVLDAWVQTAAHVVSCSPSDRDVACIDASAPSEKQGSLIAAIQSLQNGTRDPALVLASRTQLASFPNHAIVLSLPDAMMARFLSGSRLDPDVADCRTGLNSGDNFRFYKLWWEVESSRLGTDWLRLSNGGGFQPYHRDHEEVIFWKDDGYAIRNNKSTDGRLISRPQNLRYMGRSGLTYGKRTECLSVQLLPAGMVFSDEGHGVFPADERHTYVLLAILNSTVARDAMNKVAGLHKTAGYLGRLPMPATLEALRVAVNPHVEAIVRTCETWHSQDETSPRFQFPRWFLDGSASDAAEALERDEARLAEIQAEVDLQVSRHYGLDAVEHIGLLANVGASQRVIFPKLEDRAAVLDAFRHQKLAFLFGIAFGRWPTGGEGAVSQFPNPNGATARPALDAVVDDPGHPDDVLARMRSGFPWTAAPLDHLLADCLPDGDEQAFRRHIRGQPGFFDRHIAMYSKGRRRAPVYWRLGTPTGSYSVWLYLHGCGADTLHAVLRDLVEPKLAYEEDTWRRLSADVGTSPSTAQRKELATREVFVDELRAFRDELRRIAPLWNPNLDDGVVINASFLHRLFLHTKSWAKECEGHWEKLKAGDYDWAHLAMRLWPERVVPKCADDRSLAIAHGLEDVFWAEGEDGKWSPREVDEATIQRLVAERTSAAVKAALREVSAAPPPARVARALRPAPVAKAPRERAPTQPAAQLPLDLGGARPRANSSALDVLRAALHGFPDGAGRSELLAASGLDEAQWMPAITELVESREVERTGQKRGTRYTLRAGGRS